MATNRRNRSRFSQDPTVSSRAFVSIAIRVLAVLGLAVSGYLTYLHYSIATAAFCTEGSGCDLVRSSNYSSILGIPVALLGMAGFASILGISFSRLSPFRKGLSMYLLALAGVTFSVYLTYLEIAVINAICPYCVVSASLMAGILLALLLFQRPLVPRLTTESLGMYSAVVVAVVVLGSMVAYQGADSEAGDTASAYQIALARHLNDQGAVMYGAYWCPHCTNQKEAFGSAFKYVNYVECDPKGKDAKPGLCQLKGIEGFPTWEIGGSFYSGELPLERLATLSGFIQ